jgi:FkbM family methyltransferase
MINKFFNFLLPKNWMCSLIKIKRKLFVGYSTKSYSQEGEDMILRRIFKDTSDGFYIEVGAHHPKRFSNTHSFYRLGWTGINIDAMPGSMKLFRKIRKRDINIEKAISIKNEKLTYYIFNEPAFNTFSESQYRKLDGSSHCKLIEKKKLTTSTLKDIINKHLPKNQTVNFLSIDVEGLELQVLKSNDWESTKPQVVLVELLDSSIEDILDSDIYAYLKSKGYLFIAKTINTIFFKLLNENGEF